jgi:hypothetical protein
MTNLNPTVKYMHSPSLTCRYVYARAQAAQKSFMSRSCASIDSRWAGKADASRECGASDAFVEVRNTQ